MSPLASFLQNASYYVFDSSVSLLLDLDSRHGCGGIIYDARHYCNYPAMLGGVSPLRRIASDFPAYPTTPASGEHSDEVYNRRSEHVHGGHYGIEVEKLSQI